MDRREPEARAGKMWAMRAEGGRCGRSSMAVWVRSHDVVGIRESLELPDPLAEGPLLPFPFGLNRLWDLFLFHGWLREDRSSSHTRDIERSFSVKTNNLIDHMGLHLAVGTDTERSTSNPNNTEANITIAAKNQNNRINMLGITRTFFNDLPGLHNPLHTSQRRTRGGDGRGERNGRIGRAQRERGSSLQESVEISRHDERSGAKRRKKKMIQRNIRLQRPWMYGPRMRSMIS